MKVKNEFVQIKIGNKTWTHKNMILNNYLHNLFYSQIYPTHDLCYISRCYLKLDEPIQNVDYDSTILPSQFDITIVNFPNEKTFKRKSVRSKNYVKVNYLFNNNSRILINNTFYDMSILDEFINRKITGIGFGIDNVSPIYAFLDTSNMNMIINKSEKFSILRVDLFQSDGICDGIDYPLHLVNDIAFKDTKYDDNSNSNVYTKAVLNYIGFGNLLGNMEEEYPINQVQIDTDYNSITFRCNRQRKIGVYPSNNLNTGFIPLKDNSKYLIFKYRLYEIDELKNVTYLDKYYTMSMQNEDFNDLNIKLKIERL